MAHLPGIDRRSHRSVESLKESIQDNLRYVVARPAEFLSRNDWYLALAHAVRDRIVAGWIDAGKSVTEPGTRLVSYLSAEFLVGPHLANNLLNLGMMEEARAALTALGQDFDWIVSQEEEPGLGNGGLGRLAACYLDSLATLGVLAVGYGIRYEFGIFDQKIVDGWQVEITDEWLRFGNPWEIPRPELAREVGFGGSTEWYTDPSGKARKKWIPARMVKGVPYDTPVLGYHGSRANLMRLWRAEAVESFDFQSFNLGDYYHAVDAKVQSETITKVLYPNDELVAGKVLRLEQQYFFVSCALQDMMVVHLLRGHAAADFHLTWAAQLNDTHPSVAVAELMRLLVDEAGVEWDQAWDCTRRTFGYTNHTLLPEALERWPVDLFGKLLPRHLEIIYEINYKFLDQVRSRWPGDDSRVSRMSIIEEGPERKVRMANLATVGSSTVNGVAAMHSELVRNSLLRDFSEYEPRKFVNVTNGVTPRRWVALANPSLAALITEKIGAGWLSRAETGLHALEEFVEDAAFRQRWREIKLENKRRLKPILRDFAGVLVDEHSMLDVQVKRIHEYKRQALNVLRILASYLRLKRNPALQVAPRVFLFGGKAAPGYFMAKRIIRLIHAAAETINGDPAVDGRIKVVFLPDYNVKHSMPVYPAADLSEQISTAGKEASGTGNMKFALNGALTIGTLDGANVEIRSLVGEKNFFLCGMNVDEVEDLRRRGYQPRRVYEANPDLREVIDRLAAGDFSRGDRALFQPIVDNLLNDDPYLLLADFASYDECQNRVSAAWHEPEAWTTMSILNTARTGFFSSDRSIRDYCRDVWNVPVQG
jgi:glycogen phosphorylase